MGLVLGVLWVFSSNSFANSVHIYSGQFDLRIPAKPANPNEPDSRGWMNDAVINVPEHLTISDLDVCINLTHTNVIDLQIFLQSPTGKTICLNMFDVYDLDKFPVGENYKDFKDTIFDDEAQAFVKEGEAPFTDRFRPIEPYRLSAFDGQDAFGLWRLRIYDAFYFDTGRLNSVELIITAVEPPKVTVPDVVGMAQADATSAIISAGLVVGAITQQYSDIVAPGSVLSQNPPPGVPVIANSAVDLVLSCNPSRRVVPPTVMTLAATDVGRTSVTLRGLVVDDGGEPCQYRFSYWKHGFWCCTGWSDPADSKTSGQVFCQQQTGVAAGSYYFAAQAKNSAGESQWGSSQTFTILRFTGRGGGTVDDPYIITNVYELQQIERDLTACYELGNNIDAYDTKTWNNGYGFTPIGRSIVPFEGAFDGKGHVIIGLHTSRPCICVGLFGCIAEQSQIRNVGLIDVTTTGYACVGGLVGFNAGAIEACYVGGSVNGTEQVGGLVGTNDGLITNCYCVAEVFGPQQESSIGGLVGVNRSGPLKNCYSAGKVGGPAQRWAGGGLVGRCSGQCSGSFWDIEASGQAISACGIGKITAEMQTWATFADAGWDFINIWTICDGFDYPKLAWQIKPGDKFCPACPELVERDGVDMLDFALFAARWGAVGGRDLEVLARNWLAGSR